MTTPLVSICCVTYNHCKFIRKCLEGFLMQKTNFQYEILIHDDASIDGTASIIKEYQSKYPQIIKPIYQIENQYSKGVKISSTYNFPRAQGKYIAMCEGDDYWSDPFKLQTQVDFLEKNTEYSMCFHNAIEFCEDMPIRPRIFCNILESRNITLEEITESWIVPTASILIRKHVIEDYPAWTKQIYSGDLTLQLIAYSKGQIYYINQIMSFYRKTYKGESATAKVLDKLDFVYLQHAELYKLYNGYTNYKYNNILSKRISYNEKHSKFIKYRKVGTIYAFIRMPIFFIYKLYKRLF